MKKAADPKTTEGNIDIIGLHLSEITGAKPVATNEGAGIDEEGQNETAKKEEDNPNNLD